jgi:hypothetical protein
MSAIFKEFPPDHPIWADLNFTPDWIYQKQLAQAQAQAQTHAAQAAQQLRMRSLLPNSKCNAQGPRHIVNRQDINVEIASLQLSE